MRAKKVGDASTRVLETLKLLSKTPASVNEIINFLEAVNPDNKVYTNEVILKYLNTLKVFGFRIIRNKDKYSLINRLTQISLSESDLLALDKLKSMTAMFPEENLKKELNNIFKEIEPFYSDNTKYLLKNIQRIAINDKLNFSRYKKQAILYEKYCVEKQRLKITYKDGSEQKIIQADPIEIKYIDSEILLSVYNYTSTAIKNLNFNSIINVEQLPIKSNQHYGMSTNITFKLKGRLAKVYKLHEGERLIGMNSNDISIINNQEDKNQLLKRLMRYGELCEILSPKEIKQEMLQRIQDTLDLYSIN